MVSRETLQWGSKDQIGDVQKILHPEDPEKQKACDEEQEGGSQKHEDQPTDDGFLVRHDFLGLALTPSAEAALFREDLGAPGRQLNRRAGFYGVFGHMRQTIGTEDLLFLDFPTTFHAMHQRHLR